MRLNLMAQHSRVRVLCVCSVVLALACSLALLRAPTASAVVTGCHKATCIDVYPGSKNTKNRTQWVGSVYVYTVRSAQQVQAWGDGFYFQKNSTSSWFTVNRWLRSGTSVCGASVYNGSRQIACINIRV